MKIQPSLIEEVAPSELAVRNQLERVLGSEDFTASERQRRFLEFVVDAALTGQGDRIKAFTIATEVFGRNEDFDPQVDPIVRVEAGRLRRQLEHYYLAEGAGEPVVVEIPRGGYVPRFAYRPKADVRAQPEPQPAPAAESAQTPRGRRTLIAALSLLVIASGLASWWFVARSGSELTPKDVVVARPSGPIRVMVMPFDYVTDTSPHPLLDDTLATELIVSLSKLSNVEVLALSSGKEAAERRLTPQELADSLQVDYLIQGGVRQQQAQVRVNVTIIEAESSLVRSARLFEGNVESVFDLQEEMARDIASSLAVSVTPAFERRIQTMKELDAETQALYEEAMTFRIPTSDPVRSQLAEEAYHRVIELNPDFAGGYAGLAYVLASRSWWRVKGRPQVDRALALAAARKAVEKDPEFGWGLSNLALASHINGDHEGARSAAKRAGESSAGDPTALIYLALFRMFDGEQEAAAQLARSAIRLDPLSARTPYRNILGVILFQAGDYQQSLDVLQENVELGGPDGPHMAYWRAGALAALGRSQEAQSELEKVSTYPYEFDIRGFLDEFRKPEEGAKLLETLGPLGLES